MKAKKIGSVNPCGYAYLKDSRNRTIGITLDTPNAVAYAMAINNKVVSSVAHYPLFGDVVRKRADLEDRFVWVTKETNLSSYLTWV